MRGERTRGMSEYAYAVQNAAMKKRREVQKQTIKERVVEYYEKKAELLREGWTMEQVLETIGCQPKGKVLPNLGKLDGFVYTYPHNLLAAIFDDKDDPYALCNNYFDADHAFGLEHALMTLTEREQEVLKHLYQDEETLEECGKHFGVTRERIRQVGAKAVRKLRHPQRGRFIKYGFIGAEKKRIQEQYDDLLEEFESKKQETLQKISELESTLGVAEFAHKERALTKIDYLELSVRTYNCLARAGLVTIDDILKQDQKTMTKIRNMGRKSLLEIYGKLIDMGFRQFYNGEALAIPI